MGHYDGMITQSDTCKIMVVADLKALKITMEKLSHGQ